MREESAYCLLNYQNEHLYERSKGSGIFAKSRKLSRDGRVKKGRNYLKEWELLESEIGNPWSRTQEMVSRGGEEGTEQERKLREGDTQSSDSGDHGTATNWSV